MKGDDDDDDDDGNNNSMTPCNCGASFILVLDDAWLR